MKVVISRFDRSAEIGQDDVERVVGGTVEHTHSERLPRGASRR